MQSVLLLDDDPLNLQWLQILVGRLSGVQALAFQDPQEALACARAQPLDLVVVDYLMPEMNGLQFIAALGAIGAMADVPVLMITAHDEKEVRYRALEAGVYDFLPKPVDALEFAARARNMLRLRQAQVRLNAHAATLENEVAAATAELRERERETIMALVKAAGYRDYETGAHISRVGLYADVIAQGLGLPLEQQAVLREAAAMHDIGKVGIRDHILCKPGRLDDAEMAIMRTHPQLGHDLLKDSSSRLLQAGATIALTHHEKFDGSGYPHGLAGEAIPLLGRIVAVADVFDALTSQRPYKKPWPMEDAAQYLREQSGLHFDPACVQALLAAWHQVQAIGERLADAPAAPATPL